MQRTEHEGASTNLLETDTDATNTQGNHNIVHTFSMPASRYETRKRIYIQLQTIYIAIFLKN